jgi:hypothetical protein
MWNAREAPSHTGAYVSWVWHDMPDGALLISHIVCINATFFHTILRRHEASLSSVLLHLPAAKTYFNVSMFRICSDHCTVLHDGGANKRWEFGRPRKAKNSIEKEHTSKIHTCRPPCGSYSKFRVMQAADPRTNTTWNLLECFWMIQNNKHETHIHVLRGTSSKPIYQSFGWCLTVAWWYCPGTDKQEE